jgi:ribonuclease Z
MLRLTFLGTSAAQPTIDRNLTGLAVRHAGELLLFDCGEGTQRQMIRYGTGFDVGAIFFTHFHADHYLGAIGFLRTLSMQGRTAPLDLYGPRPGRKLLETMLFTGADTFSFEVRINEIAAGEAVPRTGCKVQAFATVHRTPSLGWALVEDDRPGKFDLARAEALGVPRGPLYRELQLGRAVNVDGRTIQPQEVVGRTRRGRRVVVSGDTRPCQETALAAAGADVLVHDSTFGDEELERASETRHSTAREAARIASQAGVKQLVLTHLSTRYDREPGILVGQAVQEVPGAVAARDGMVIEVPLPDGEKEQADPTPEPDGQGAPTPR